MKRNDTLSHLNTLWDALHCYRDCLIPEGDEMYDQEWDELCTAMAWIAEDLGCADEIYSDQAANFNNEK